MNALPPLDKLSYRVKDAAPHLGMSKAKLWELIAEGRIPARKLTAGVTVILRDDLVAFLEASPTDRRPTGHPKPKSGLESGDMGRDGQI